MLGWVGGIFGALVLVAAGLFHWLNDVPDDLDLSATRLSAQGLYRIRYVSRRDPIPLNQIHTWTIHIETADGRPVEHAAVSVDGKMPQHIHGLPTRPQVTKELGHGDYLVEGLKFHMLDWWVVEFQVDAAGARDIVRFDLVLSLRPEWSKHEVATLRSLWIGSLPQLPPDPSNRVADDPRAVVLGRKLFFDARLSANGKVACASCHQPALLFQDGQPLAQGVGTTTRKTMTIAGTGYSPWLFWDGRKDSQWAQALGPLESAVEHGGTRTQYAHVIAQHYRAEYEALFGALPQLSDARRFPVRAGPVDDAAARAAWERMADADREAVTRTFANIGKAIAAYERRIMPGPSRFDAYVQAVLKDDLAATRSALTPGEAAGLRLFIGKAQCINCHNGPLFTDNHFHNTGVPVRAGVPKDVGRAKGALQARDDEFNCLSPYSDAPPDECAELKYIVAAGAELEGAFKPSSLRNISATGPYMHAGQFASLREVLQHYQRAPAAPVGRTELKPLHLSTVELDHLQAFLHSLSGGIVTREH